MKTPRKSSRSGRSGAKGRDIGHASEENAPISDGAGSARRNKKKRRKTESRQNSRSMHGADQEESSRSAARSPAESELTRAVAVVDEQSSLAGELRAELALVLQDQFRIEDELKTLTEIERDRTREASARLQETEQQVELLHVALETERGQTLSLARSAEEVACRLKDMESTSGALAATLSEAETKLAETSRHTAAVEDELACERGRAGEVARRIDETNARLGEVQQAFDGLAAALNESKAQLAAAETRESSLRKALSEAERAGLAGKERITELQALISRERQRSAELADTVATVENVLAAERDTMASLIARAADADAALARERLQSESLKATFAAAEARELSLQRALDEAEGARLVGDEQIACLHTLLSKERQKAAELSDAVATAHSELEARCLEVSELRADLNSWLSEATRWDDLHAASIEHASRLERALAEARSALERSQVDHDALCASTEALKSDLSATQARAQTLESEVAVQKASARQAWARCDGLERELVGRAEEHIARTRKTVYLLGRALHLRKKDPHQSIDADVKLIERFLSQFEPHRLGITEPADRRTRILKYLLGLSEELMEFPLCNSESYLFRYKDVKVGGMNALVHYLRHGGKEGRDIHPLLDTKCYLEQYPDVGALDELPVVHYIKWGAEKGYNPHPLFDTRYYFDRYRDVAVAGLNPLIHYLKYPRCTPHTLFDTAFYLHSNPDVAASGQNPLVHYLTSGASEGRYPHPLFNARFYLNAYPDVAAAGTNPLVHFVTKGALEERQPNPDFDTAFYLRTYPDVAASALNPLVHYVKFGASEGRQTKATSAPASKKASAAHVIEPGRHDRRPSVLMIDAMYPRPDQDSGSNDQISFINIFKALNYRVYFIADIEFGVTSRYRDALEERGVTCVAYPAYSSVEEFLRLNADRIDLCFLSRVHFGGRHFETIRTTCQNARIIFNTVDLHYLREEREARLKQNDEALAQAIETREREHHIIKAADVTIVVSLKEQEMVKEGLPGANVSIVPLIRDYRSGRENGFERRSGIGFIGSFLHRPNVDAVNYFLDEIWPRVRNALPHVKFYVIGSNLPDALATRKDPGVVFVGYVPALEARLETLRLTVAPLRYGAGAKGKIVCSLGHGVPCVASPIAAEGMGLVEGVHIAIGRSPEQFTDEIVAVYENSQRWLRLSDVGLALIREQHSLNCGVDLVRDILTSMGPK